MGGFVFGLVLGAIIMIAVGTIGLVWYFKDVYR